jgi:hypothetical protein
MVRATWGVVGVGQETDTLPQPNLPSGIPPAPFLAGREKTGPPLHPVFFSRPGKSHTAPPRSAATQHPPRFWGGQGGALCGGTHRAKAGAQRNAETRGEGPALLLASICKRAGPGDPSYEKPRTRPGAARSQKKTRGRVDIIPFYQTPGCVSIRGPGFDKMNYVVGLCAFHPRTRPDHSLWFSMPRLRRQNGFTRRRWLRDFDGTGPLLFRDPRTAQADGALALARCFFGRAQGRRQPEGGPAFCSRTPEIAKGFEFLRKRVHERPVVER